jgi:hypothetical protein
MGIVKRRANKTSKGTVLSRKPLPKLLENAQQVFNRYVRHRDEGLACISCGGNGTQAGHYFPVKGFSVVRFDEWNVNLQCAYCNCYLHGNQAMYRIGLVKKIGEKAVKELESKAQQKVYKWDRDVLEEIIKKYSV